MIITVMDRTTDASFKSMQVDLMLNERKPEEDIKVGKPYLNI